MCKSALHPFLAHLPKVEHHMHLEGALSPELLFSLAAKNDISLPSPATDPAFASAPALLARYEAGFASLDDFLAYYYLGMSVLLHADDFEALAWAYFRRARADGVMHAEVFFDPQAHTGRGVAYATVVEGFTRACRRAESELGISTGLILCFLRHLPAAEAHGALDAAGEDLRSGKLLGVGLDSSEMGFPPELFRGVYARAAAMGTRRTAHAGEEGGPAMVRGALEALGVERIDHGWRMAADDGLMAEVARRGLLVTLCPLSNVRLRGVGRVADLPVRTFIERGVDFSINSDDPAYFGGYILANYCAVQEAFDLGVHDWERVVKCSIRGSWCSDARKAEMVAALRTCLEEHGPKRSG